MARFVPLTLRALAVGLGFLIGCGAVVHAQTLMQATSASAKAPATNTPAAKSSPSVTTAKAPATNAPAAKSSSSVTTAKPPATNAAPALPPAMQNTLDRYGNILAPGDQVPYPLKLKLPIPSEAEVYVPKSDDLVKREKIEELAKLSDDDIRKALAEWPAYGKMSLRDQASMLQRIQDFRDYHSRVAQQKAHDMGLLTLSPDQKAKFEKEYWDQRLKLDEDLTRQFEPIYQAREQKMNDALFREFSSAAPSPAPPPPKPTPPPAPKPPQPPAKPVASTVGPSVTNAAPMAQTRH